MPVFSRHAWSQSPRRCCQSTSWATARSASICSSTSAARADSGSRSAPSQVCEVAVMRHGRSRPSAAGAGSTKPYRASWCRWWDASAWLMPSWRAASAAVVGPSRPTSPCSLRRSGWASARMTTGSARMRRLPTDSKDMLGILDRGRRGCQALAWNLHHVPALHSQVLTSTVLAMNTTRLSPGAQAVLGLLSRQPTSGYELGSTAERTIAHFWPITRAHIYAELARLEAAGLVTATEVSQQRRPDKRVYAITGAGEAALDAWLASPDLDHFQAVVAKLEGDPGAIWRRATAMYGVHCTQGQLAWLDAVEPLIAPADRSA